MLNHQLQGGIGDKEDLEPFGQFGYFFDTAAQATDDWIRLAGLDALSNAVCNDGTWAAKPDTDVRRFGRFVFDNLVHVLDLNNSLRCVLDDELVPMSRFLVTMTFANAFSGLVGEDMRRPSGIRANSIRWPLPPKGQKSQRAGAGPVCPRNDGDAADEARQAWAVCQNLILNQFLPQVLDASVWNWIKANGTPLYDSFLKQQIPYRTGGALPLPVEVVFSVLPALGFISAKPSTFAAGDHIGDEAKNQLRTRANSAKRFLRTDYLLNIPSANHCIQELNSRFDLGLTTLTGADLCVGRAAEAVLFAQMEGEIPLWFYCLREMPSQEDGALRLGPLASHLVGQTLVGAIKAERDGGRHGPSQRESTRGACALDFDDTASGMTLSDFLRLVEPA